MAPLKNEGHEAINPVDAHNRAVNRDEDLTQDLKVTQIMDQPGTGRRPARRVTRKAPK